MNSIWFTYGGYHYFLVPKEDEYYWLMTDDVDNLQYLEVNEVITSITKGETVLLTLGQKFGDKVVSEIQVIEDNISKFKVKLS